MMILMTSPKLNGAVFYKKNLDLTMKPSFASIIPLPSFTITVFPTTYAKFKKTLRELIST